MSLFDKIASRFNISETKIKVFRNLYWAVLGKVITLLGSLLVGIFVARYLGPEQYGLMNYVISFITLFQVFATFGLDNIEIREESKKDADRDVLVGTALTIRCVFAFLTMCLVILVTCIFEADTFTRTMIIVYSFSMIFNAFGAIRNHFTALIWNEYIVKTEISRTIIGAVIKITLLFFDASLAWFIYATLFDTILIASGYLFSYQKKIASICKWQFDLQTAKYLIKEAAPLVISLSAVILYQQIDRIMIGKMLSSEALGYFSVATAFVNVLLFVPQILAQTITPLLVQAYHRDNKEYEQKTQVFVSFTIWICLALSVLTCLCSYWLIRYTYGEQYLSAVIVLQVLVFKTIPSALSSTAGQTIIIESKQKYAWIRNVTACGLCVLLNLWLIPKYSVMGATVASIVVTLYAGTLANIFIPPYHKVLRIQMHALFLGWKDLFNIKRIIK